MKQVSYIQGPIIRSGDLSTPRRGTDLQKKLSRSQMLGKMPGQGGRRVDKLPVKPRVAGWETKYRTPL